MNMRTRKKKQKALQRATYQAYPSGPGNAQLFVPAQQNQGVYGQTFYGSQTHNVPVGQIPIFSPGAPLPNLPGVNPFGRPIQFPFRVAENTFPVDRTMGNPEIPSFQQLRMLSKLYNGITLCERAWFDMVPKMKLNVTLKPEYIAAGAEPKDYQTEITYFLNWFESPDKMHDLHSWLRMALREQTQIDELYIYKRKKRNGKLHALEIIAGDTMKPLLNDWGKIPEPPDFAYQQYPWSIPGAWFRTDELIHYQESPAADTPYGQSRVERIIMLVNQALRKQKKDLAHFTEGNIPQGMMLVPESAIWTPDQIDAFEQAWNALIAGNEHQQVRMRFTQPGMKYQPFEQYILDPTFDKFLINISVSAYGLSMQDVAFTEDIHKSSGDFQENVTYRRTVDPLATIYAQMLTDVVNTDFPPELKGEMFQIAFGGYEEEEDVSEMSGAYTQLVNAGILGVTNAGKLLKLPDDPNAPYIGRVIVTKDGPVFLDDMATDKMRAAQVQAQLAGLQAASTNPTQGSTGQKPPQPEQTAKTTSTANSQTSSGAQQPQIKKPNALKTANSAPQLNPKYNAAPGQSNKTAATEDIGGMNPQLRASKSQVNGEKSDDEIDDPTLDDKFHDFVDHKGSAQQNDDDFSDFDPSLMGDTMVDIGPENFEDLQDIEDLGGDAGSWFDPNYDEDKEDWSDGDYDTENEIELLLNSDKDEPFSELERSIVGALERHHPGGHDHDQKTHGNWAHPNQTTANPSSGSGASGAYPATKGPGAGAYGPINKKIIAASGAVQTAAKDLLTARQNLENASAADKANARKAVATARQELHDARHALELYRQQARQMRIQAQQQARAEAAKQRAEKKVEEAKAKAERQKAKAKLAAQKQKAHLAKVAAAAKAKSAKLAAKAQLKAQIAAAKAAKATAKASTKSSFKAAAANHSSAKTVQSLTSTLASKAVLYNTLASRPISKNWTQQDAADAHQISLDMKQLADMVNNHDDAEQMTGLLNQMNTAMSELAGSSRFSHKISANSGKPGAASSARITHAVQPGRAGVFEKLLAKAQSEAALNRAIEGLEFYEEQEGYSYAISDIIELFEKQGKDEETSEEDEENIERSEQVTVVERTIRGEEEYFREKRNGENVVYRSSGLDDLRKQGIIATTWRSQCTCAACEKNNNLTKQLGQPFPSGHMLPPCHEDCPCGAEYHTTKDRSLEYKNWRQRAIDDVKAGRTFRGFTSVLIPDFMHRYISDELVECTSIDAVKDVFQRAREKENASSVFTVFVDIDGVISIANAGNRKEEIDGKDAWPIPHYAYLLQLLATDPRMKPVWMTHWGMKANWFNDRADVQHFPVAFPLSKTAEESANALFPQLARKQLAIAYYLHAHPAERVIWIQDGFAPETKTWAEHNHILLIDTNAEPMHSQLLGKTEKDIQSFLQGTLYERV